MPKWGPGFAETGEFAGIGADGDRPGNETGKVVGNLETTAKTKANRSMIHEVSQKGIGKRSRLVESCWDQITLVYCLSNSLTMRLAR